MVTPKNMQETDAANAREDWLRGVKHQKRLVLAGIWTEEGAHEILTRRYERWKRLEALRPQADQEELFEERNPYHE